MNLKELRQRFDSLYHELPDFEIGEGWCLILYEVSLILQNLLKDWEEANGPKPQVLSVEEDHGILHIDISSATPQILNFLTQASEASSHTCSRCGASGGKCSIQGEVKVRCKECWAKQTGMKVPVRR